MAPRSGRDDGNGPRRLGDLLSGVMARLGIERDIDDYRLWEAWDEVVGATVARNAQPIRLDARRLVVAVKSNAWMQELTLLRKDVCQRLNEWMGREVVSDIFLVVGRVEAGPTRERQPAPTAARRSSKTKVGVPVIPRLRAMRAVSSSSGS